MNRIIALSTISVLILVTAFTFVPAVFADSSTHMNISFQTSAGNSAGWVTGPGTGSSSEAYLTINNPTGFSFAVITLHHFPTTLPIATPSFTSPQYQSGTPRIYIQMSDGNYMFIYPDGTSDVNCATSTCTSVSGGPSAVVYAAFTSAEGGTPVSAVFIVADTSQAVPYTAFITCFQYNAVYLVGSAPTC